MMVLRYEMFLPFLLPLVLWFLFGVAVQRLIRVLRFLRRGRVGRRLC